MSINEIDNIIDIIAMSVSNSDYLDIKQDLTTFMDEINEESIDLISFDEISQPIQQLPSIEQELNETKNKLRLLEERLIKLEQNTCQTFSIIPMNGYLLDINCEKVKMNFDMIHFDCGNACFLWYRSLTENNLTFFKQFQKIKTLEIEFNDNIFLNPVDGTQQKIKKIISTILQILLDNNLEIIFKCTIIEEKFKGIFEEFMNNIENKKIILDFFINCSNIIDIYEGVLDDFMKSDYYRHLVISNHTKIDSSHYHCKINKNNYNFIKYNINLIGFDGL